jgi:hypothetical protein
MKSAAEKLEVNGKVWSEVTDDGARRVRVAPAIVEHLVRIVLPFSTAEDSGARLIDSISLRVALQNRVRETLREELVEWDPDALEALSLRARWRG